MTLQLAQAKRRLKTNRRIVDFCTGSVVKSLVRRSTRGDDTRRYRVMVRGPGVHSVIYTTELAEAVRFFKDLDYPGRAG